MKPAVSRLLRLGLTGLILVMLVLFARKVNWHDTWHTMQAASLPMLLLAAGVNLASIVVKGIRWWVFLRPIGARSLALALRATFAGAGLNNVLVANGGEAARVVFVARAAHVPSAKVLATLALERLFELVGYVVLLSLAATFLELPHSLERVKPFAIAILVAMGALLVWLLRRPDVVETVAGPKPVSWHGRLKQYGSRFVQTIGQVSSPARFIAALTLSVVAWALQVMNHYLHSPSGPPPAGHPGPHPPRLPPRRPPCRRPRRPPRGRCPPGPWGSLGGRRGKTWGSSRQRTPPRRRPSEWTTTRPSPWPS